MSEDEIKSLRRVYEALSRWDVEGFVSDVSHDFELITPDTVPWGGPRHGHDGMRTWLESVEQTWRSMEGAPRALATLGDRTLAAVDIHGIGHESGAPIEQEVFLLYTIRGGKIAAVFPYMSEREGLDAIGVS